MVSISEDAHTKKQEDQEGFANSITIPLSGESNSSLILPAACIIDQYAIQPSPSAVLLCLLSVSSAAA